MGGHHWFASNEKRLARWRPSFVGFSVANLFVRVGDAEQYNSIFTVVSLEKLALNLHHCNPTSHVGDICVLLKPRTVVVHRNVSTIETTSKTAEDVQVFSIYFWMLPFLGFIKWGNTVRL